MSESSSPEAESMEQAEAAALGRLSEMDDPALVEFDQSETTGQTIRDWLLSHGSAEVVQSAFRSGGQHRAPSIPDVLIAATAEVAGLIVLHLDKDFEMIAKVTGQSIERIANDP